MTNYMQKILIMVASALIMTSAWALPAMAVDTTFYGTYRVRLFSTSNNQDYASGKQSTYTGTGSNTTESDVVSDANAWIDQRFRLAVESKASDQLRGFVQLEMGNFSGPNRSHEWGTTASASNIGVYVRQAYLSFNAGPVRVKAGRSVFGDAPDGGQSFRVSDDGVYWGLLDGGLIVVSQVDGFIFAAKPADQLAIAAGYVKLGESSTSGSSSTGAYDKDDTLYILEAVLMPSDAITAAGYFLYDRNMSSATGVANAARADTPWWLGAGVSAKLDPITLKVHAAYKGGKQENGCQPGSSCGLAATDSATDLKYSAYAIDADVSAKVGPATVGFAAGLGSGDKSTQDTKSKTFSGVAPAYGNQLGARPAIFFDGGEVSNGGVVINSYYSNSISGKTSTCTSTGANCATSTTLGNITFAELYASVKPTDELTVGGLLAGFWLTEKKRTTSSTNTNTWESKLGYEIDLTATYKLYKELALVGQAAWFLPGDGIKSYKDQTGDYTGIASDDAVSEYYAKIQYDF